MKQMFLLRRKAMVYTDKRAKLIQEILGGMKIIKFFGTFSLRPRETSTHPPPSQLGKSRTQRRSTKCAKLRWVISEDCLLLGLPTPPSQCPCLCWPLSLLVRIA